jgi:hypothetical protein
MILIVHTVYGLCFFILDKPTVWLRCVQINYTTYIGDNLSVSSNQQSVFRHWHGLLDIFIIEIWNLPFLNNLIVYKTKIRLRQA